MLLKLFRYFQNFKREEQNFVVQNEINNLSFLTGDNKTKMSKVSFVPACFLSTLPPYVLNFTLQQINPELFVDKKIY